MSKSKKNNHLIKYGAGITACAYFLLYIYVFLYKEEKNEEIEILPFFYGVILAPILEELAFRGFFTNKKPLKYIAFILLIGYIVLLKAFIITPLVLLFLWLYFKKDKRRNLQYFLNATIFSLAHLNFTTDIDFISIFYIFIRIGIGSMLIWIVINFNIFISILAHSLHNFTIFSLQFLVLFFEPITDIPRNLSSEKIDLRIEQVNQLKHSKNISIYKNETIYTCYNLEDFLNNIDIVIKENDSLDINPEFKNNKYEFILIKKDTNELDLKTILSLLEQENYLIKKHSN